MINQLSLVPTPSSVGMHTRATVHLPTEGEAVADMLFILTTKNGVKTAYPYSSKYPM